MRVVIAGGSGFLGQALTRQLVAGGHRVTVLTRGESGTPQPGVDTVLWNPDGTADVWARAIEGADAIVNLSGAGIADRRWTASRRAVLATSRVRPTRSLIAAVEGCRERPSVFVQGSGIGYYGASLDDREIDESRPPGNDFLGRLCVEWEASARPAAALGCRFVTMRSGLVLAKHGGVLPAMARPFKLFAGGPIGSGRQYVPWIHLHDWVAIVAWVIGNTAIAGAFNAAAPHPVTNEEFSRELGRALGRPNWLRVPPLALRTLLGSKMADVLLLNGQRAVPARALAEGFRFQFANVDAALSNALNEG
ncbi:MAG: TIGR01777 family oxidoreductase [Acidobacteriota bacterium]